MQAHRSYKILMPTAHGYIKITSQLILAVFLEQKMFEKKNIIFYRLNKFPELYLHF